MRRTAFLVVICGYYTNYCSVDWRCSREENLLVLLELILLPMYGNFMPQVNRDILCYTFLFLQKLAISFRLQSGFLEEFSLLCIGKYPVGDQHHTCHVLANEFHYILN